jgi:hypothetical protein
MFHVKREIYCELNGFAARSFRFRCIRVCLVHTPPFHVERPGLQMALCSTWNVSQVPPPMVLQTARLLIA